MTTLAATIEVPLTVTEYGTIRVKGSRVSLDSIVHQFKLGATAEQIVDSFPSLNLADVYAAIAYYLSHHDDIEAYLQRQEAEADILRQQIEADPKHQATTAELRERILARWATRQEPAGPATSD